MDNTGRSVKETDNGLGFTTSEFIRMIEVGAFDDMTVELIAGRIVRMPLPETMHAAWHARGMGRIASAVDPGHGIGSVGIILRPDTLVACDAAVLIDPIDDARISRPPMSRWSSKLRSAESRAISA